MAWMFYQLILFNIVITGAINLVCTVIAMATVDRFGRRPLMLLGFAGVGVSHLLLGLAYRTGLRGLPVLLLGAERDQLVSAAAIRRVAGLLPKGEIYLAPQRSSLPGPSWNHQAEPSASSSSMRSSSSRVQGPFRSIQRTGKAILESLYKVGR